MGGDWWTVTVFRVESCAVIEDIDEEEKIDLNIPKGMKFKLLEGHGKIILYYGSFEQIHQMMFPGPYDIDPEDYYWQFHQWEKIQNKQHEESFNSLFKEIQENYPKAKMICGNFTILTNTLTIF